MAYLDSVQMQQALADLENKNYSAALNLLIPLAETGNPRAQCNLATLYHLGLGVEMNGTRAVELYGQVARQNIRESCLSGVAYNNLATIYFTGLPGVEQNNEKGNEYLRLAKDLGFSM
jgi:TPR repeat protein